MIIPLSDYPPLEYSIYIGILEQDPELESFAIVADWTG